MRDCDTLDLQSQGSASVYSELNGWWRSVPGRKGYLLSLKNELPDFQILKIWIWHVQGISINVIVLFLEPEPGLVFSLIVMYAWS